MVEEKKAATLPYISFKTLLNMAERLEPEPPPRIDRSVIGYLSTGYQTQVIAALKVLALTDDSGVPTADLVELVTHPADRKTVIARVWLRAYAEIFSTVDVAKATTDQLSEAFTVLGMTGDTRTKAMIFFVHGAKFAEIPLSARIAGGIKRVRPTITRRRPRTETPTETRAHDEDAAGTDTQRGTVRVPVHPMLEGAITWLAENGPKWTAEQQQIWSANFIGNVALVYPPKQPATHEPTE